MARNLLPMGERQLLELKTSQFSTICRFPYPREAGCQFLDGAMMMMMMIVMMTLVGTMVILVQED